MMSTQSSRNQEFTSLLFTPRTGEQQGLPDYRSPRPNRSPSVHGYGRAKSYAEGTTPRSRRSLTPTGSIKDTSMQPAPPSQSLADNLAAPPAASLPEPNSASEATAMYTRDQQGRAVSKLSVQSLEEDEVWVTVYGFQPSQRHLIMKEFSKCGDILKFGNGREDGTNWVHIQFSNKYGAQRALQRNGVLVSRELMVGVQLLEPRMRSQLGASLPAPSPALPEPSTASGAVSSSSALSSQSLVHVPPKPHVQQQLRPHRIQAVSTQGPIPQSSQSTLSMLKEFVFGL